MQIMVIKSPNYKNGLNKKMCASDLQCRHLIIAMPETIDKYRDPELAKLTDAQEFGLELLKQKTILLFFIFFVSELNKPMQLVNTITTNGFYKKKQNQKNPK